MSTLNVSNITDGTTTVGTSYVVNGSARAWLNMDGTGTVAIRGSFNTSSITDDATGKYTQTYTSNMSSDDYSVSTSSANSTGFIESIKVNRYNLFEPIYTNGMQVACWNNNSAWTDTQFVLLQSFGDLA
jgi:hypothetical protein